MSFSKTNRLLGQLVNGRTLTVSAAKKNLRFTSRKAVHKAVRRLRWEGYSIYTRKAIAGNNHKVIFYTLNTPSKKFLKAFNSGNKTEAVKVLYSDIVG
jgi:hypothetical protein